MRQTGKDGRILGDVKTREEVMREIRANQKVYSEFLNLNKDFQERFIEFCMGIRGVMMTYDSFFQRILDVEAHPERLSELVSQIVGKRLKVKRALPKEHRRISEKGSLLIMDILAETEEGDLVDVEIQKVGYLFPGQRASCYSADMVMRQYEREKSRCGENFTYKDMKKVYTIVLVEKSSKEFQQFPDKYIHRGGWKFDTGIQLDLLQEVYFISLDIFLHIQDNRNEDESISELEAWLYFLGSDKTEHIQKIIDNYPRFEEMYREIVRFRYSPEEAIGMFSEALKVLDENTVKYMIEEMKQELEESQKKLGDSLQELDQTWKDLQESQQELEASQQELQASQQELQASQQELEASQQELQASQQELQASQQEISRLKSLLKEAGINE